MQKRNSRAAFLRACAAGLPAAGVPQQPRRGGVARGGRRHVGGGNHLLTVMHPLATALVTLVRRALKGVAHRLHGLRGAECFDGACSCVGLFGIQFSWQRLTPAVAAAATDEQQAADFTSSAAPAPHVVPSLTVYSCAAADGEEEADFTDSGSEEDEELDDEEQPLMARLQRRGAAGTARAAGSSRAAGASRSTGARSGSRGSRGAAQQGRQGGSARAAAGSGRQRPRAAAADRNAPTEAHRYDARQELCLAALPPQASAVPSSALSGRVPAF